MDIANQCSWCLKLDADSAAYWLHILGPDPVANGVRESLGQINQERFRRALSREVKIA
jgi:hypothetical protein